MQAFLVDFLDCVLSCRFGNFLCNRYTLYTSYTVFRIHIYWFSSPKINFLNFSENEREKAGVFEACSCLWEHLEGMRASEGSTHVHYNIFYKPSKHDGPLLPPAAALAPTLWPQFHLRWSCPSETQSGDVETQCRSMMEKYSELERVIDMLYSSFFCASLVPICITSRWLSPIRYSG